MTAAYDDTLDYLERRYLTLQQLAERSGVPPARLEVLMAAGLLPAHSHEATFRLTVYAPVNGHHPTADKCVRYYHADVAELAVGADAKARELGVAEAALAIRARHDAAVREASPLQAGDPALAALTDAAWQAWRDGTLGVCLQRFSPADIVRKTDAVNVMAAALESARVAGPAAVDRHALAAAIAAYAAVAGPFGPHERDGSTRARFYEPALALATRLEQAAA